VIAGLSVLLQSGLASDRKVLPALNSGQVYAITDLASSEADQWRYFLNQLSVFRSLSS
jgi:hypothetical protein